MRNRLYANLGQAYVATGQMQKAVNAFEEAIADKTYFLSDSASVDYQRAVAAVAQGTSEMHPGHGPGFGAWWRSYLRFGRSSGSMWQLTAPACMPSRMPMPLSRPPTPYYYGDGPMADRCPASTARQRATTASSRATDEELEQWSKRRCQAAIASAATSA